MCNKLYIYVFNQQNQDDWLKEQIHKIIPKFVEPRGTIHIYILYFTFFIFPICLCQRSRSIFWYIDQARSICFLPDFVRTRFLSQIYNNKNMPSDRFACIEYNIANSSWHFGPNGSLWTGLSPTKQYMDLSFASVHIIFCG